MKNLPSIYSIQDIERNYTYTSQGHWFDKDSMRFFKSRLTVHFRKLSETDFLFITTEQGPSGKRMASLRRCTIEPDTEKYCGYRMNIETVGEFNSLTMYQARKAMKEYEA